ncbi:MAG TPA: Asp-tRNA(Asn)/Glu-tRNA(Gln) amidotransferase subunit GatC [Gemmatimonadaceae bacterium]|nr:Asp-tRNA(Asn)/Glu-tRNA(Gln) amidotransferase subunit GatC [Gemmatimonadaceae bacterium]
MSVTIDDVKHVARLARLGVTESRAAELVGELNRILDHMSMLEKVDTEGVAEAAGVGASGMPLRVDAGPPIPLARALADFAPAVRDGLIIVPRLASHEGAGSDDAVEEG